MQLCISAVSWYILFYAFLSFYLSLLSGRGMQQPKKRIVQKLQFLITWCLCIWVFIMPLLYYTLTEHMVTIKIYLWLSMEMHTIMDKTMMMKMILNIDNNRQDWESNIFRECKHSNNKDNSLHFNNQIKISSPLILKQ